MFLINFLFSNYSFWAQTFFILFMLYFLILLTIHITKGLYSVFYDYVKDPFIYDIQNFRFNLVFLFIVVEFVYNFMTPNIL